MTNNVCPKCLQSFDVPKEFVKHIQTCDAVRKAAPMKKSKFNNIKTEYNGTTYDSKLEASYAEHLDKLIEVDGGLNRILYWLRQVPFDLPGKVKYRVDFMVVHENKYDGLYIEYIDVKGRETAMFKLKKKQVEALYPVEIITVKKGEF